MQEMNCIHLSRSDYPAIISAVIVPTPAPGLKNSRDIASIVEDVIAFQTAMEKKRQKVTSLCRYLLVMQQFKKTKLVMKKKNQSMRTKIIIWTTVLSFGLILTSCVVSNPKFFANTQQTDDASYGYTPENPITIKNSDLNNSIGSSYYYLSRLRTEKGNKLQLVQRFSVNNPNYKKPAVPLTNRYTGQPMNYGTGPLLDYYILVPENERDTVKLYINPYLKGEIKVPVGLKFENE